MNYRLTTDTHLGHKRLHESALGGRPHDFEERILADIKKSCCGFGVFIHLGDVSLYKDAHWQDQLMQAIPAGYKRWLARGNHDDKSISWYLDRGWDCVADQFLINAFGKNILLSHKPVADRDDFDLNIHGHWHHPRHHFDDPKGDKQHLLYLEHDYKVFDLRTIVEAQHDKRTR